MKREVVKCVAVCRSCGTGVSFDEDGCCVTCGRDCEQAELRVRCHAPLSAALSKAIEAVMRTAYRQMMREWRKP